ncbi:hypothetical protein Tco_0920723 [Tanacetum coccineum]
MIGDDVYKGRMPTKIELTLEQSQQGVSNDVLTFRDDTLFSIHNDEWKSFQCHHQTALRSYALSWKPCQGDSLNLPDHRYQVYQGRLLASFQDDAKYEHVGQDTRSQGGKDEKTKSKDNDKSSIS